MEKEKCGQTAGAVSKITLFRAPKRALLSSSLATLAIVVVVDKAIRSGRTMKAEIIFMIFSK